MHVLCALAFALTLPVGGSSVEIAPETDDPRLGLQQPLHAPGPRKLHGRFLHITDLHPDPFYKVHSSTESDAACHRGSGAAGYYGAEVSDCDSPLSLINATFRWIETHLQDSVDFVVWTGDSARHSNDEEIPRTQEQVLDQNRLVAHKFVEVFGVADGRGVDARSVPVIPTIGNNDVSPHNQLARGPNKWTRAYGEIWRDFIPAEQRHAFRKRGSFYVEVIPDRLAVISLNTMFFFDSNIQVEGCAPRSEPGHEHLQWLRVQLGRMRRRGMKAILIGHVPSARTESKANWFESCWQGFTAIARDYRDIIVGSMYGHMNIDHFFLHDSEEIDSRRVQAREGLPDEQQAVGGGVSSQTAENYLVELRESWSKLPRPPKDRSADGDDMAEIGMKHKKHKSKKYLDEIGGEWAERYMVGLVSPSVIPNYYPTLRVFEYNITGLDSTFLPDISTALDPKVVSEHLQQRETEATNSIPSSEPDPGQAGPSDDLYQPTSERITTLAAKGPSRSTPPGPAYSPQTFTLLGYTQYFANLTDLNNNFTHAPWSQDAMRPASPDATKWRLREHHRDYARDGRFKGPKEFKFEVEYETRTDRIYKLPDLTVRSYLRLAQRIGAYRPDHEDEDDVSCDGVMKMKEGGGVAAEHEWPSVGVSSKIKQDAEHGQDAEDEQEEEQAKADHDDATHPSAKHKKHKKKHKKHKKHKSPRSIDETWFTFVKRAFVGTKDDQEIRDEFGDVVVPNLQRSSNALGGGSGEVEQADEL